MSEELRKRLDEIVARRHAQLPLVQERIDRLDAVDRHVRDLVAAAGDLPPEWLSMPEINGALDRLRDSEIRTSLATARASLVGVKERFARETINLGVTGRARVGKSAMLQSVSGLGDAQVPTGESANVTAVRSRIFHASRTSASIRFHTEVSFLDEVVRPYFRELRLSPMPSSLGQFSQADLTGPAEGGDSATARDMRRRLRVIQKAVRQLRLDGGESTLTDLSDLRRFVAYEATEDIDREESGGLDAPRDYLAVRDCRIDAPFPVTDVDRLGLVDLPGLGEVAADIGERIAAGLRGEVDVVLMVFRAAVGLTNIDEIDQRALDLITGAQGAIDDSRDFAWVVINAGPSDETRAADLRSQIRNRLNDSVDNSRYNVVTANGLSADSMHSEVLLPVLERLASRLPVMDEQVLKGAVLEMEAPLNVVNAAVSVLMTSLASVRSQTPSVRQELDQFAHTMHMDVQRALTAMRPHVVVQEFVALYEKQIDTVHDEVRYWLADGLGRFAAADEWAVRADGEYGLVQSHRPFLLGELHRLRVAITRRYANLDAYLNNVLVEDFYRMVTDSFIGVSEPGAYGESQRAFLAGTAESGAARIEAIMDRLKACDPPVAGLLAAFESLAGIHFDFRLQSYPLLFELNLDMRPVDSDNDDECYPPNFSSDFTIAMYQWLEEEFIQYSYRVKSELREDASRQFKVLAGAAVVLEDEVVRSGTSTAEFRNLADGYRDELWPDRFNTVNSLSARGRLLQQRTADLFNAVRSALEVN